MAKTTDPQLIVRLREESERTKDDPVPTAPELLLEQVTASYAITAVDERAHLRLGHLSRPEGDLKASVAVWEGLLGAERAVYTNESRS